jgi:tyrosine-protein phosphatase YwqE
MFHFLKKNAVLKDLIPSDYVDIHSHLLPGIDDGAVVIEDTLFLITELQKMGCKQFITTPHIYTTVWDNTKAIIQQKYNDTLPALAKDTSIKFGAEYMIDPYFVNLFQNEPLATLKDNYVLVELSYINPPIQLYDILFELQIAGYRPILAHPERYPFYNSNLNEFTKLKNAGCLFQLNLLSTVGYYGIEATKSCELLLKKGLIDFVGSDVHHSKHIESFSNKILVSSVSPLKKAIENNQFFKF